MLRGTIAPYGPIRTRWNPYAGMAQAGYYIRPVVSIVRTFTKSRNPTAWGFRNWYIGRNSFLSYLRNVAASRNGAASMSGRLTNPDLRNIY